ncbi:hypothetical protein CCM_04007 [Cordyceps militaris CM01]|uniref:Uncharacterized protein n=1 Tax=Cordyceps militaris (strain CM01) TaxID=983644 RepID=G3JDF9_CORMM|nr:uncharacterized protein CCM_04007 [Cordyceps militaris CM01]EGX92634.1 hypothetical protein CCM_04007 [Cordyceps militaris CM01]
MTCASFSEMALTEVQEYRKISFLSSSGQSGVTSLFVNNSTLTSVLTHIQLAESNTRAKTPSPTTVVLVPRLSGDFEARKSSSFHSTRPPLFQLKARTFIPVTPQRRLLFPGAVSCLRLMCLPSETRSRSVSLLDASSSQTLATV